MMRQRNYFPLLILILVSFLIDLYVYQGIQKLTENLDYSLIIRFLYWIISITVLTSFVYLLSKVFPSREFTKLFNFSFNSFLTLFVSKLAFILVLFLEDIFRFLTALYHSFLDGYSIPERSLLISEFALILCAIPFCSFIFGVTFGKYNYKVRKVVLFHKDLPEEFNNFTLVQISDIHAGSFDNPKAVKKGIDLINSLNPDLFVFTGDLVNNKATEIIPYLEIFKLIQAPFGKFSILGNHDYGDYISWPDSHEKINNLKLLKEYHQQLGFRLLLDQHSLIKKGEDQITLLGVENWGKGFGERGDLRKALNNVNADDFKILLSHDPSHWDAQIKKHPSKIHLTLSGHTHGMQFGIEIGKFKWSPVKYRYPNWAGLAEENDRYLYVNRGFGFLGFAGRIGIWPEITHITLRKK
ncbi:metallophosphoesterase [Daejeonella oryzae]|uniref:metallophosphoesterase n=1 Tax=Daejeonella oryzae TaxID=1122943 RepID=UPI0003FFB682|nr:metallophosphoesterase [Daejeonella oryzae]